MPLTLDEVEHIARLAHLDLTAEQKALYRDQLSKILDYVAKLRQLDTRSVEPTAGGGLACMELRQDRSRPGLSTEALLANASESEDDQFRIPPVFE